MTHHDHDDLERFLSALRDRNPAQPEFLQAVREVLKDVWSRVEPRHRRAAILERLTEPDRVITVRVSWIDAADRVRVNRAWRVQHSNALGPYKGGLRFQRGLDLSTLKFLAFEQTFKDALTGLPLGGAKGGADFDPKNASETDVMRFCQALMTALHQYVGPDVDVPAGDLGVGQREIGYLFGQYKRLGDRFDGVLTGKSELWGGSPGRVAATGRGCVHFLRAMLRRRGEDVEGKRVAISGAGAVARHAARRLARWGARVVTLSDTSGFVHAEDGFDDGTLEGLLEAKRARRSLAEAAGEAGVRHAEGRPWSARCDVALPCATQNELDGDDASWLVENGVKAVAEGANMPCTPAAVARFTDAGVAFAPGKAANAGGVAVSALEMSQNALGLPYGEAEIERRLEEIMTDIHDRCVAEGRRDDGSVDYARGANVAAFRRVADAMVEQGVT